MKFSSFIVIAGILGFSLVANMPCLGQDLVYHPKNPAFGGSPLNYQWLLSSANTQNKYKEVPDYGLNDDPLANFHQDLQRQILTQLTQSIVRSKLGDSFDLSKETTLEFGEFSIDVIPSGDGVSIRIFDVQTGKETSITIPGING